MNFISEYFNAMKGFAEHSRLIFRFGQKPVGMIDADFCSGVDAVLAFPEFNQPGSATIRLSAGLFLQTFRPVS